MKYVALTALSLCVATTAALRVCPRAASPWRCDSRRCTRVPWSIGVLSMLSDGDGEAAENEAATAAAGSGWSSAPAAAGPSQWEDAAKESISDGDAWGGEDDGSWAGSSWAEAEAADIDGPAADDWLSAVAARAPVRRTKPIETIKVGRLETPYKRRNGYHVEVAVQHTGTEETIHRLWFGFEVLDDVATLRGRERHDVDVKGFGEAVIGYLQQQGVDLADEDWGMQDDSIPFSVQQLPMRTLFEYYPNMPAALAETCLAHLDGQAEEEEEPRPLSGDDFDVPLLLDRPFIDKGEAARSSREELQAAVDRGFGVFSSPAESEEQEAESEEAGAEAAAAAMEE